MRTAQDRVIDQILVMRCQEGSGRAFELLVRRWQRRLWRYAAKLTGESAAAWDVTQEAWLVMLKGIRRLDDPALFATWAYRIVRNKCADHWRRRGRRQKLTETLAERQAADSPQRDQEQPQRVAEAIRRLSADKQELLALRYREDLSIGEIARVLGVPGGTVKSRLYHAREELKRFLESEGVQP